MGSNDSKSTSQPLNALQRQQSYNAGMASIEGSMPTEGYQAPTQQRLTGGDYDRLQGKLTDGYTAPLDRAKSKDIELFNNSAGAKGIWSTGLALRGEKDINEGYAPQYAKAGADATSQRYALQTAENTEGNNMALQNAMNKYNANWRPADYKAGIWNGTGGVVSSSQGGGWSI